MAELEMCTRCGLDYPKEGIVVLEGAPHCVSCTTFVDRSSGEDLSIFEVPEGSEQLVKKTVLDERRPQERSIMEPARIGVRQYRCPSCSYSFSRESKSRQTLRCPYCSSENIIEDRLSF